MSITTVAELEQARAALTARPVEELVDFILSLAAASGGVAEYVHAFALADSKAVAEDLTNELKLLRDGETGSYRNYQQGAEYVARVDRWLDAVERSVSIRDPQAALRLLVAFLEIQEQIVEHSWDDDFGLSELFARVRKLCEKLMQLEPEGRVNPVLKRLLEQLNESYGM